MRSLLSEAKIYRREKSDLDYIHNEIIYQGLLNKKAFENAYEELRSELYDSWEHMEYDEKVNYINRVMDPLKITMPSFSFQETTITIPFLTNFSTLCITTG